MYQAVLFDLDGTLVDNFVAIHAAYAEVASGLGFKPEPIETIRRVVGGSIPITLGKLLPAEVVPQAAERYREAFDRLWQEGLFLLPGAVEILAELNARGVRCAVFTNKVGIHSRMICDHLGLSPHLDFVLGVGDHPGRKPDPAFTRAALERIRGTPATTCMIGDSPFDIAAAKGAPMSCYTVTTGSHDAAALAAAGADGVYPDLPTLSSRVFGLDLLAAATRA